MADHASLDPGKWKMGLAVSDGGLIVVAEPVYVPRGPWTFNSAVIAVMEAVLKAGRGIDSWTIEHPRVYPGMGSAATRGDVEALEDLAGRLRNELVGVYGAKVKLVRPHAWKGNVPKAVHHRRIRAHLKPSELALLDRDFGSAAFDVWDAVGIELFSLGRVGRGGTRPH